MSVVMERETVERKIIKVTGKRQITIPLKFYNQLGIDKDLECYADGKVLILKPLKSGNDDFSVEILSDLISQGYEGQELLDKFKEETKNINNAIKDVIKEAKEIAEGKITGYTIDEVFEEE